MFSFFFFNEPATTEIYTLSLHDALPISIQRHLTTRIAQRKLAQVRQQCGIDLKERLGVVLRSEEHTSELQSQSNLVCRLLLEKKKYQSFTSLFEICYQYAYTRYTDSSVF